MHSDDAKMTIREQIDRELDPTDSNVCGNVAYASIKLLQYAARAIWAQNNGMRIGRDDARELGVAINKMGVALGLMPSFYNGVDSDAFFARLLAETGIVAMEPPKRPTIAELDAILNSEEDTPITINPDGSITA